MELRTLRYFLAVAREENMTEAANVLHVTQPTLSRQIADLERELGVELFERTNRSCVLTSDGMRLRQRAEEIVLLVEQTELELADRELGIAGVIRIGAGETKSMRLVLDAFTELHRNYPGVTIELYTGNADAVEERLERGLLDFALLLEPVNVEKYESIRISRGRSSRCRCCRERSMGRPGCADACGRGEYAAAGEFAHLESSAGPRSVVEWRP